MAVPLGNNVKELVDRANFAHLAILRKDGSPRVDPVWIGREGDPRRSVARASRPTS